MWWTQLMAVAVMFGLGPVEREVAVVLALEGRLAEYGCLAEIIEAESSWDPAALGDRGRSHGLVQRHAPAHGAPPSPWPVADQVRWALEYADARYGSVCAGLEFRRLRGWW